ncbi:hypothetical protein PanWU01x14_002090 [Parasponia andersonii]|uniref:Uncharacterized protein n=1 Tax=Parasponia andersonii TaxID=3476 RepID=A0A2P5E544_PARAD|nr:hypothetical protein PanWU01x14_002090 [Parasponia andersonii]
MSSTLARLVPEFHMFIQPSATPDIFLMSPPSTLPPRFRSEPPPLTSDTQNNADQDETNLDS